MPDGQHIGKRYDYLFDQLSEAKLLEDPIEQLRLWIEEADQQGVIEANAMCLSTSTPEGRPSGRMLLLRNLDQRGLVFFTNYESRKGSELNANPFGAATFWWPEMERQVRVEGRVERVAEAESEAYFHSRPKESRLASASSPQSQPIESDEVISARMRELEALHGDTIPKPGNWGGYRLVPDRIEFWQGRPARLHDRFLFQRDGEEWNVTRLAP